MTLLKTTRHIKMSVLFTISFCFTMIYCFPNNISSIDITSENNVNDKSQQIIEQEVIDYNEDYDQIEINSEVNSDYSEFSTEKINNNFKNQVHPYENNYEIYNSEENSDYEQIILNRLKTLFNVGNILTTKKNSADFDAPQFMTDLFYAISEQNSNTVQTIPYGASAILSLPETNPSSPGLFKFDLSGLTDQDILDAELHIYRIGREVSIPLHHSPYYLLRVYQILPNENIMSWNPDVHQLLNVHYVSSFITGWQVFKIKRALDSWLDNSAPNLGFLITASTVVNEPIEINFARRNQYNNKYQPSLVLFTKPKRQMNDIKLDYKNYKTNANPDDLKKSECSKKLMYINFTSNYFNNFIIEPKGYEAYQCSGTCKHPENLESPNYSVLKSALHTLKIISTSTCCVPENIKSLTVLYRSEEKTVLQQIEDMIVESCSCR